MSLATSSSMIAAEASEKSFDGCAPRIPMNGSESPPPSWTAPTRSLMPYWVTMARATFVAFSMSFWAPVVGSWKIISSAARPPIM